VRVCVRGSESGLVQPACVAKRVCASSAAAQPPPPCSVFSARSFTERPTCHQVLSLHHGLNLCMQGLRLMGWVMRLLTFKQPEHRPTRKNDPHTHRHTHYQLGFSFDAHLCLDVHAHVLAGQDTKRLLQLHTNFICIVSIRG
jgi:hypothetical protein